METGNENNFKTSAVATLEQHLPRLETDGTYLEEGTPWQGLQEGRVLQDKSQSVCKGSQQKRNKWPAELILEFYLLSIFSVAPGFAGPGEWPTTGTPFLYHEVRTPCGSELLRARISGGDRDLRCRELRCLMVPS